MTSFFFRSDPGALGIGVACTGAAVNLSDGARADHRAAAFEQISGQLGVDIAVVSQVHGRRVVDLDQQPARAQRGLLDLTHEQADALVTSQRGVALAIRVADCIPVLFWDARAGVLGAAHAGRAGILNGVLAATVDAMAARGASDMRAWIGPHVCGACYEVPAEMADDFAQRTAIPPVATRWGTLGVDLGAAAHAQLDALGVPFDGQETCTMEDAGLHSYRRDAAASGRMAALIWRC